MSDNRLENVGLKQETLDIEKIKLQVSEIFDDPERDYTEAEEILRRYDKNGLIEKSNEVQRSLVRRIKLELKKDPGEFNVENINSFVEALSFPEVLKMIPEIKDAALNTFFDNFYNNSLDDWVTFLNLFDLTNNSDVIDHVVELVEKSISTQNGSDEEISDYLSNIWKNFGHSKLVDAEVKNAIVNLESGDMLNAADLTRDKLKVNGFVDDYKDSEIYQDTEEDSDDSFS